MPAPSPAFGFVITANHLMTGEAVYYARAEMMPENHCNNWLQTIDKNTIFESEEQASHQLEAIQKTQNHLIVGAYIIGLDSDDTPITYRERLRLSGPTNYWHGKQESGG